jgi:hypothetical protein
MEPVANASPAGLVPTLSKIGNLSFLNLVPLDTNPPVFPCHWKFLDWSRTRLDGSRSDLPSAPPI